MNPSEYNSTYQYRNSQRRAPLKNSDLPSGSFFPGHYFVHLEPGYTIENHNRTVGAAGLPEGSSKGVEVLSMHSDTLYYTAQLTECALDTIILDPGVQLVEHYVVGWVDDD